MLRALLAREQQQQQQQQQQQPPLFLALCNFPHALSDRLFRWAPELRRTFVADPFLWLCFGSAAADPSEPAARALAEEEARKGGG